MIRTLIAGLAGGIALFIWGWVSWGMLPWHQATLRFLEPPETVNETVRAMGATEPGVYLWPEPVSDMSDQDAMAEYTQQHEQGFGLLIFHPAPGDPMSPTLMAKGAGISILIGVLLAGMMQMVVVPGFFQRILFATALGVVAALSADANLWNWFYAPQDYTIVGALDRIIGFFIAGLIPAAVVKKPKPASATD